MKSEVDNINEPYANCDYKKSSHINDIGNKSAMEYKGNSKKSAMARNIKDNFSTISISGTNGASDAGASDDDFKNLCEKVDIIGTYTLEDTKCESSLSSIPYPKLCLPKYISPNRNMCISGENIII